MSHVVFFVYWLVDWKNEMAKFVVYYELRDGTKQRGGIHTITVECESERTAIESARSQAESKNPGWDFSPKKVESK